MSIPDLQQEIISYIRQNRVSTTEVADCLGKTGAIRNVSAVTTGHFCVGKVFFCYTHEESNWPVHEQVQELQPDDILVVNHWECGERAIFGDIVAKYCLLYKQAQALVVDGKLRDGHRIVKERWPIWCSGFNPEGCFNNKPNAEPDQDWLKQRRELFEGGIAVCDDTGVVVIPKSEQNSKFIGKLEAIEEQEDIWYECIDRRKWSTFKTICLKDYLND